MTDVPCNMEGQTVGVQHAYINAQLAISALIILECSYVDHSVTSPANLDYYIGTAAVAQTITSSVDTNCDALTDVTDIAYTITDSTGAVVYDTNTNGADISGVSSWIQSINGEEIVIYSTDFANQ